MNFDTLTEAATPPASSVCRPACDTIRLEISRDFSAIEELRSAWDDTVIESGSPVYMTYDWVRTWWEFYGKGRELRLFMFWVEGRLVALLPIYLETFDLGVFKTRVARLVGSNIPPKTFDPPVDPNWAAQVFEQALSSLFVKDRCDMISLGPVSKTWRSGQALRQVCEQNTKLVGRLETFGDEVQTVFHLPHTFEEYLQELSPGERKSRSKRLRQLEKKFALSTDIVSAPDLAAGEYERFAQLHAEQWAVIGKAGHFGAWPKADEYNRELVRRQAEAGRVRFYRMLLDGKVVVNRYAFQLGDTLFSELPARSVGEPWDKLGIGGCSMIKFNQDAISQGVLTIDSGIGGYEHKSQMGGTEVPVKIWRITNQRRLSYIRARVFVAVATAIKFLFHKIWYRRVVPYLPGKMGRKQSLWWLRFDA